MSLALPDEKDAAANYLYIVFESELNKDDHYQYRLYYYGMNGRTFYAPGSLNISFSSLYLSRAAGLLKAQFSGMIPGPGGAPSTTSILKRYFPGGRIEKEPQTYTFDATGLVDATMKLDTVHILYKDNVIATFPISFYEPKDEALKDQKNSQVIFQKLIGGPKSLL